MQFFEVAAQRLALPAGGRDTVKAWKQDSAEALKTAKKRGDSLLSTARCVSHLLLLFCVLQIGFRT